jgi:hypothetical protein
MSLDSFIATIRLTDIARTNRYVFTLLLPPGLIGKNYTLETLTLFADDISGAFNWNIATRGQSIGTTPYNTPYAAFNEDSSVTVTFLMDGNMHIRHLFDDWANLTYDQEKGQVEFYDNLRTTARLELLNQSDIPVYAWEFYDVMLDKLAPVSFNNSQSKFLELVTTFTYRYWKAVEPTPVNMVYRQEENAIQELYRIVKPYLAAKYPQIGKIEQRVSDINNAVRAIGSIFGR